MLILNVICLFCCHSNRLNRLSKKMVRISEEMIRRKAEHNEKEISTLEELSLHQENIEKIEYLQHWCKNLEILLLQSNIISRIENLGKLKKLRYLNLALNNIERIENLEGLESLEKLDLMLNFIGDLESVSTLASNIHLQILILTGNPCTEYQFYREYVITVLPQIRLLDSLEINRSERILAKQNFENKVKVVAEQQIKYLRKRESEKAAGGDCDEENSDESLNEEDVERFWNESSKNTPEERTRIARKTEKIRQKEQGVKPKEKPKEVKLFSKDGRPLNLNQPKLPFRLTEDEENGCLELDVAVYRYLDSSLVSVDLQPKYVTIRVKGQVFQITFEREILIDKSTCQRSQTTGHLLLRMPITGWSAPRKMIPDKVTERGSKHKQESQCQFLEVEDYKTVDVSKICVFEDNPEVPPLE